MRHVALQRLVILKVNSIVISAEMFDRFYDCNVPNIVNNASRSLVIDQ